MSGYPLHLPQPRWKIAKCLPVVSTLDFSVKNTKKGVALRQSFLQSGKYSIGNPYTEVSHFQSDGAHGLGSQAARPRKGPTGTRRGKRRGPAEQMNFPVKSFDKEMSLRGPTPHSEPRASRGTRQSGSGRRDPTARGAGPGAVKAGSRGQVALRNAEREQGSPGSSGRRGQREGPARVGRGGRGAAGTRPQGAWGRRGSLPPNAASPGRSSSFPDCPKGA